MQAGMSLRARLKDYFLEGKRTWKRFELYYFFEVDSNDIGTSHFARDIEQPKNVNQDSWEGRCMVVILQGVQAQSMEDDFLLAWA